MKFRHLQTKIAFWAGICLVCTAAIIVTYAVMTMRLKAAATREQAIKDVQEYAASIAKHRASAIQAELDAALDVARTLAQNFAGIKDPDVGLELDRDQANGLLRTTLAHNPTFVGIGTMWEPNAFDYMDRGFINEAGQDATGRFVPHWSRSPEGELVVDAYKDYETADVYRLPKTTQNEWILEPYVFPVQDQPTFVTSLIAPIIAADTFYGTVAIDLRFDSFQHLVDDVQTIYDGAAQILMISHHGAVAAMTGTPEFAGKPIKDVYPAWDAFGASLQRGESVITTDNHQLAVFTPINVGHTTTPWSVAVVIPEANITAFADQEMRQAQTDLMRMVGLSVVCTIIALGVLWFVSGSITRPIVQTGAVARKLAKGDFTVAVRVAHTDEIGALSTAFQMMQAKISEVVRDVKTTVQDVAQRSREMSTVAEQMSQGAAQQATSTEEVSASMEQMAANIRQTAENARLTESMAVTSAEDARAGKQAVTEIIQAMEVIAERISVVQEIAGQTNILSLNATIEAAKAQDFGKGFAVVATSVRELASRSRAAADEIRTLVHSCVVLSAQAGEVLQRLVPNSEKTAELVQEINASSQEQSTGVEHVNQAVQQLDTVTQQNSATAEQVAATAESLTARADALQQTMAFFTVDETQPVSSAETDELLHGLQGIEKERLVALLTSALSGQSQPPTAAATGLSGPSVSAHGEAIDLDAPNANDERDAEFERY